jgi:solute:Na+ symporter, SSS family
MSNTTEYLILVVIVFAIYLITGIFPFSKLNRENFLISGRKLGGISNGFSIAASKIGGGLLVTYSTLFFAFGWSAIFYFAGIIIGYLFFYLFAFKLVNESKENNYYTVADYFSNKFGNKVGLVIGVLTTCSVLGWIFTNLAAGGIILSNITDISPIFTTITLALVIGLYLYVGGFSSVIKTDIIQYIALLTIASIFVLVLYTTDFQTHDIQVSSVPIGLNIGFVFLGILFPMGSGELWQRIYSSRNTKEFKKSLVIASVSYVVLGIFLSIICFRILAVVPSSLLSVKNELKLTLGVEYLVKNIHPILPFVWLVAYLSAIISTADTFVFTTASSIVQDLLQKSGRIKAEQVVSVIKLSIIVLLILGVIVAYFFPDVVSLTFLFVGISLVISSLAYFSRVEKLKKSRRSFYISGLIGFCSVSFHFIVSGFEANITTALIGFGSATICLLLTLLWNRKKR